MARQFKGWIPNVSGALSFSTFGEVSHPPRVVTANRADRRVRYVVCYQARDKSDVQIPSAFAPTLFKIQGRIWFLCLATTSPAVEAAQHYLNGDVYLFTDQDTLDEYVKPLIRDAQSELRQFHSGLSSGSITDHFAASYAKLENELPRFSAFGAKFSIHRSGTTLITLPDNMLTSPTAPKLPEESIQRAHYEQLLAAQIFFFLRDIGHRHQHHDPSTDTIVDVHELETNDDVTWRRLTLFGLYRHIIRFKRIKDGTRFTMRWEFSLMRAPFTT